MMLLQSRAAMHVLGRQGVIRKEALPLRPGMVNKGHDGVAKRDATNEVRGERNGTRRRVSLCVSVAMAGSFDGLFFILFRSRERDDKLYLLTRHRF